eukprot:CAMPEP_0119102742 /NCGR_PEP_ID=MMETSP1180-20130426/1375_1 /TAXON_ID=3052 ORGANISM="Chlamydomonas cf sp, Strain CCMP681" /NCGR_SAMPLE_ID=MMETSP1180 /ASSEMBLY_ACC=CAM_ASM_000741 /LENGTH=68 /DNA_ID=CAMNT_0007087073 /DNA_START=36 /DNA_END=242 /DNA_ORIENTATION=+
MTVFVIVFLPGTKGQPLEEIDSLFIDHWVWGRVLASERVVAEIAHFKLKEAELGVQNPITFGSAAPLS